MRNGGGIPTRHLADGKIPGPTLHNYLESEGFRRGFNDRSIFWHPEHDVGDLTYVNNNYLDGEEDEVTWATDTINKRLQGPRLGANGWCSYWLPGHAHVYEAYLAMHLQSRSCNGLVLSLWL